MRNGMVGHISMASNGEGLQPGSWDRFLEAVGPCARFLTDCWGLAPQRVAGVSLTKDMCFPNDALAPTSFTMDIVQRTLVPP